MIETLDDIIEQLSDEIGHYGSHSELHPDGQCECRVCFTADLKCRIAQAIEVDRKLAAPTHELEPTLAEETSELRSEAVDWKSQCDQLRSAIAEHGGTTRYGDHGQVVVTWPAVEKEWRVFWSGQSVPIATAVLASEERADVIVGIDNGSARKQYRTAPGPWQDA